MDYLTRVRNLRNDSGYSQEYVGNVLHVSQRTYADYELGKIKLIGNTPAVNENFYTYDVSEQKYKKELIRKASLCG